MKVPWSSLAWDMHDFEAGSSALRVPYWFKTRRAADDVGSGEKGPGTLTEASRVLVLNLDRQVDRWTDFQQEARSHPLDEGTSLLDRCERFPAIDGRATPIASYPPTEIEATYTLDDFYFVDNQPQLGVLANRSGISILESPQEMAVAQSHIQLWKVVGAGTAPVLIIEDDVRFLPGFTHRLSELMDTLARDRNSIDLLYVSYRAADSGIARSDIRDLYFRPTTGLWWLSGYVLSPAGASKLLARLPVRGPVDQWLNHQFTELQVFCSTTPLITQRRDRASDNLYSVIPVLRAVRGAVSASRATGPAPQTRSEGGGLRRPVFAIGLNKTGTTSLHEALQVLGYRSCHWQSDAFSEATGRLIDADTALEFDAYTDVQSIVERFEELDQRYPTAAFILTVRDLDEWLASRARHVARNRAENWIEGRPIHTWTEVDLEAWRTERLMHHESVLRYFKDQPEKLLVLDICGGDSWAPLCRFLNQPLPPVPFPRIDPLEVRPLGSSAPTQPAATGEFRPTTVLEHDDFPWISKDHDLACIQSRQRPLGTFAPLFTDSFETLDPDRWTVLDDTFETNRAMYRPANATHGPSGLDLTVREEACGDRAFTAAAIATLDTPARHFLYGRFEAELRPTAGAGLLSGVFLYRRNPWQEIDLEFLGSQTDQMLINVYFNPGNEGDLYNYGMRGTPVLVELGFDASQEFHRYAIEWDPVGIRWYVDGVLVHARASAPTPVPHLPLRLYCNTWPIDAVELAGDVDPTALPATTTLRRLSASSWRPEGSARRA